MTLTKKYPEFGEVFNYEKVPYDKRHEVLNRKIKVIEEILDKHFVRRKDDVQEEHENNEFGGRIDGNTRN